jgi:hypothetical protein
MRMASRAQGLTMRSDMQKIIVERPRWGSAFPNYKSGLRLHADQVRSAVETADDFDSGPARASSARRYKGLNENLAPLRRYLAQQVGRPWDKVFSEIRKNLDTRSALGLHVMQHLEQFIAVKTFLIDGVVHARRWRGLDPVEGLYVHPVSGLVRYLKPKPRRRRRWNEPDPNREPNFVRLSPTTAFEKIDGIWYRFEYVILDDGLSDLLSKRQCDSKTIRRIERGELGRLTARLS